MANPRRLLLLSALLFVANFVTADDVNRQLHDTYMNKTLLLRGFYSGDRLRYDSSGSPVGGNASGDWTSDGFVLITDIGVKGHEIWIKAARVSAVFQNKTFSLRMAENQIVRPGENKAIIAEITADLGTKHPTADQAEAVLAKIFLSGNDDFANLIPEYWKPCVPAGLAGKDEICRFAPEILSIPGVKLPDEAALRTAGETPKPDPPAVQRLLISKGLSPPRLTSHKEPEFNDLARRMRYQGTETLAITVNQQGIPMKVHVLTPLGCGLDMQAVHAVEGWRFQPAEKDGHPVSVDIAVEVDFHLY